MLLSIRSFIGWLGGSTAIFTCLIEVLPFLRDRDIDDNLTLNTAQSRYLNRFFPLSAPVANSLFTRMCTLSNHSLCLGRLSILAQAPRLKAIKRVSRISQLSHPNTDATATRHLFDGETADLVIIGAGGAIGLPASYLAATLRKLKVVMIDRGGAALDSSTHTVHTSITRPNNAVWPVGRAVESWLHNGPFDVNLTPMFLPFAFHSVLQTYFVSEDRLFRMWNAFRRLVIESNQIYQTLDKELGSIKAGGTGRAHLPSLLVPGDHETALGLREKLCAVGVESEVINDPKYIQSYVGRLRVRHPDLMIRYPEDFVLDLMKYKARAHDAIIANGGVFLRDTVSGLEQDSKGKITAVLTQTGARIKTGAVLYTGGWWAGFFLKKWLGINLDYHLTVASGVRFVLPDHMVDRSIVGGPMFLAPGYNASGLPVTDVGQMFLTNFTSGFPNEKHLAQAIERFHTYFDYQGPISKVWSCVGRPITTSGMPFIEKVAPNMVVALGPGMFGVTVGTGLAKRGLDLLLDDVAHPDHPFFDRQPCWKIVARFLQDKLASRSRPPQKDEDDIHRVVQLGKRGAMTAVLEQMLSQTFPYAVYGSREIDAVIEDIRKHQAVVLLVASHGPQARLPAHYGSDYLYADEAIRKVLDESETQHLRGIVVISGGIPKPRLHALMSSANRRKVRFVHLPGLATSMEVLLTALQSLLPFVDRNSKITIEDTFHKGKKEIPSAGGSQLLGMMVNRFGEERVLITVDEPVSEETEIRAQFPAARVKSARTDQDSEGFRRQHPDLTHIIGRSHRIDGTSYHYQHRVSLEMSAVTVSLEQTVTDRARLVSPVRKVIQRLDSLEPDFTGTSISSVLPVVRFEPRSSLQDALVAIIQGLQDVGALVRLRTRDAKPNKFLQGLLTDSLGQSRRFQHSPALSSCLQLEAEIDSQSLILTVSLASHIP